MIYINIISFLQINAPEKDHSLIETRQLENIAIFLQTVIKFCFACANQICTKTLCRSRM